MSGKTVSGKTVPSVYEDYYVEFCAECQDRFMCTDYSKFKVGDRQLLISRCCDVRCKMLMVMKELNC
jgi:hypothetical protein